MFLVVYVSIICTFTSYMMSMQSRLHWYNRIWIVSTFLFRAQWLQTRCKCDCTIALESTFTFTSDLLITLFSLLLISASHYKLRIDLLCMVIIISLLLLLLLMLVVVMGQSYRDRLLAGAGLVILAFVHCNVIKIELFNNTIRSLYISTSKT